MIFFLLLKFANDKIGADISMAEKVDWYILSDDHLHQKAWYFTFTKWKMEYVALCWFLLFGPKKIEHIWVYRIFFAYYCFEFIDYWMTYNQTEEDIQIAFLGVLTVLVYMNYNMSD